MRLATLGLASRPAQLPGRPRPASPTDGTGTPGPQPQKFSKLVFLVEG